MQYSILQEYQDSLGRANRLFNKIEHLRKEILKTRLFSKERILKLSEIKCLRKEIEENCKRVSDCYNTLRDYSVYDSDFVLPLIKDYMSLVEGEEYCILSVSGSKNIEECEPDYYLITTLENKKTIEEHNIPKNIYDYSKTCTDNKCVCFEKKDTQTLLDSFELFVNYPYLIDFSFDLLATELSNPNITKESVRKLVLQKKDK